MKEIPIMFCFNNNYVIPAIACFNSILRNCNKDNKYTFYVLQTDISQKNKEMLTLEVKKFKNAKLVFKDMNQKFENIFEIMPNKSHFSREMFYKLICPSIFPKLDRIIVTDVDVVFLDDIGKIYDELDEKSSDYICGIAPIPKKGLNFYDSKSYNKFTSDEIIKLKNGVGAGFLLLNLKAMRENNIEEKFINYLENNYTKLIQPEQDVINIICNDHIKKLPYNYMVCTYEYNDFDNGNNFEILKNKEDIDSVKYALNHPIQLHYATHIKPWKYIDSTKSEIWFSYMASTVLAEEYFKQLPKNMKTVNSSWIKFQKTKLYKKLLSVYHFFRKIV